MKKLTHTFKPNQQVFFNNERLPYKVMAVSERYVVVSRKLHRRQDADLLHFEVRRGASVSFTEAYKCHKNDPVYSIIDFKENERAPDNYTIGNLDYSKPKDCKEAIKRLENGEMALSRRSVAELQIDWDRTNKINLKK